MGNINFMEVLVYLDDLIVFCRTLEEHNQHLFKVFDRLKEKVKVKPISKSKVGVNAFAVHKQQRFCLPDGEKA